MKPVLSAARRHNSASCFVYSSPEVNVGAVRAARRLADHVDFDLGPLGTVTDALAHMPLPDITYGYDAQRQATTIVTVN
jgi:hypothetical protein